MSDFIIQTTFQYGAQDKIDALENHFQVVKGWCHRSKNVRVKDFVSIGVGEIWKENFSITYDFTVEADSYEQAITLFREMTTMGSIESIKSKELRTDSK